MLPLTEKYRPRTLTHLRGQVEAAAVLGSFVRAPHSTAFMFEGDTGTGKTSAAHALANDLGCEVAQSEFGGLHEIASGEQSAENVRETLKLLNYRPFYGSGWTVLIANEADRMSTTAETIWLDALEHLPGHTVVVFTTNHPEKLADRFRDRCERVRFDSDAETIKTSIIELIGDIWQRETGRDDRPPVKLSAIVSDGKASFRRAVQEVSRLLQLHRSTIPPAPVGRLFAEVA